MRHSTLITLIVSVTLVSCGTYVRIDQRQIGDSALTCPEIRKQLESLSEIENQANASVSGGKQAWRVIGFFPSAIKAQTNANATRRDVRQRREQLFALSDKAECKF